MCGIIRDTDKQKSVDKKKTAGSKETNLNSLIRAPLITTSLTYPRASFW